MSRSILRSKEALTPKKPPALVCRRYPALCEANLLNHIIKPRESQGISSLLSREREYQAISSSCIAIWTHEPLMICPSMLRKPSREIEDIAALSS
jgi:hypothetical protein